MLQFHKNLSNAEAVFKLLDINKIYPLKVAEIGVRNGDFAEYILRNAVSIEKYYAVDPYLPYLDLQYQFTQAEQDRLKFKAFLRLAVFPQVEWVYEKSLDFAAKQTHQFDFVFIDAEHTYECVTADIAAFAPLIKSGGLLIGHDYCMEQVHKAVQEYARVNQKEIAWTGADSDVWALEM